MKIKFLSVTALLTLSMAACKKNDAVVVTQQTTITVSNVLNAQPLVESGIFVNSSPGPILPGQSVSFKFSAAKGQAITFACMYGWSNDLFFAPANPGIQVYDTNGVPIQGDVSSKIKLWDNGTRVNQVPGSAVTHPGVAQSNVIAEVAGTDAQGNNYLPASSLVSASLTYNGSSIFTLTITNISGGTANQTPISGGVWAVSYVAAGVMLNPAPLYLSGQVTANGLSSIAEMGNTAPLYTYIQGITGIFTPFSPVLVVVYNGITNPIFNVGEIDRGQGLKFLSQKGDATTLAAALKVTAGVKSVYILPAATTILLPSLYGSTGSSVSQLLAVSAGDRIAIATMYGGSNDWFFASSGNGADATVKGDISASIALYNDGSAVDQFPGAGGSQGGNTGFPNVAQTVPIALVPNPNPFTTLPAISNIISVTLK